MRGAIDESCMRLARALRRPPDLLETALLEVGVDAAYLERALLDGDPQGAITAVGQRMGIDRSDLVRAIIATSAAPQRAARAAATPEARDAALRLFLGRRLPRALRAASWLALAFGAALGTFASLAVWRPEAFREALVILAAVTVLLGAVACVALAWRMRHAARELERLARRDGTTKRS